MLHSGEQKAKKGKSTNNNSELWLKANEKVKITKMRQSQAEPKSKNKNNDHFTSKKIRQKWALDKIYLLKLIVFIHTCFSLYKYNI